MPDDQSEPRSDLTQQGTDLSTGWLEAHTCTAGGRPSRDGYAGGPCPMRDVRHRHREDGTPEPAVADSIWPGGEQTVGALPDDLVEPERPWDRAVLDNFVEGGPTHGRSLKSIREQVGALLDQLDRGWAWVQGETEKARRAIARLENDPNRDYVCSALAEWRERDMSLSDVRIQVFGEHEDDPRGDEPEEGVDIAPLRRLVDEVNRVAHKGMTHTPTDHGLREVLRACVLPEPSESPQEGS